MGLKRLRRKTLWSNQIVGGHIKYEATLRDGRRHPHLHILAEGFGCLTEGELAAAWCSITDACVVSFKIVDDPEYLSNVSRYVAKPPQRDFFDSPAELNEFLGETEGLRLHGTFGTLRGRSHVS
jgi:hypothetical protein